MVVSLVHRYPWVSSESESEFLDSQCTVVICVFVFVSRAHAHSHVPILDHLLRFSLIKSVQPRVAIPSRSQTLDLKKGKSNGKAGTETNLGRTAGTSGNDRRDGTS